MSEPPIVPTDAAYELPAAGPSLAVVAVRDQSVSEELLRQNVDWYIALRWLVVAVFAVAAALALTDLPRRGGLALAPGWLAAVAAGLALVNLAYWGHRRWIIGAGQAGVQFNLWTQIVVDLLTVTVVVHHLGSVLSVAPFLYVPHLVLACVFFPRRTSLLVAGLAALCYSGCLWLEHVLNLGGKQILTAVGALALPPAAEAWYAASALVLWLCIWFPVARLAGRVRQHERQIAEAQERTQRTFAEAQQHLRHTLHQMKAPVDAVRSNLMLLQESCGEHLSPTAADLVQRIEIRTLVLNELLGDLLRLSRLKAGEPLSREWRELPLDALAAAAVESLRPNAAGRGVTVVVEASPVSVAGDPEALRLLLDNLLTNAITYSQPGGEVRVTCQAAPADGHAVLHVADRGIGIPADKLPRIFDEYYRTEEAKKHHPFSTGVGLAIVRQVAAAHGIRVHVASTLGQGTTFTLDFPRPAPRRPPGGQDAPDAR